MRQVTQCGSVTAGSGVLAQSGICRVVEQIARFNNFTLKRFIIVQSERTQNFKSIFQNSFINLQGSTKLLMKPL